MRILAHNKDAGQFLQSSSLWLAVVGRHIFVRSPSIAAVEAPTFRVYSTDTLEFVCDLVRYGLSCFTVLIQRCEEAAAAERPARRRGFRPVSCNMCDVNLASLDVEAATSRTLQAVG